MNATTTLRYEAYAAEEARAALRTAVRNTGKAAALVAAPFIGLAFVIGLPVIGLGVLAWLAVRAAAARWPGAARIIKRVALFLAAPFIGLAYAFALPFVGIGALAWTAVRAARGA